MSEWWGREVRNVMMVVIGMVHAYLHHTFVNAFNTVESGETASKWADSCETAGGKGPWTGKGSIGAQTMRSIMRSIHPQP